MELLVGATHCEEFVDEVDKLITQRYPSGIESLMLEIPSNWQEVERYYDPFDHFFLELAKRYKKRGTKVAYGGMPINLSKIPSWWWILFDSFVTHGEDKAMIRTIENENPQVVVVGKKHANYLKRNYPNVFYVAFDVTPFDTPDAIVCKLLGRAYKPNQVVNLVHKLPMEYYLRKYHII